MSLLIELEQVSKSFVLSKREPLALRQGFLAVLKTLISPTAKEAKVFFALENISLQIHRGECVGIVGQNGSGKTTLLRLISGIFMPSSGKIRIHQGQVGLASINMYFMSELSGRENIAFSMALHGFDYRQLGDLQKQIIEFAELETFIDAPVKTYSNGMKSRLGFSILIHLLPDILLLDEILAVGDSAFQNKCLAALQALIARGQTIVVVAHNAATLSKLCTRIIWLERGHIQMDGKPDEVLLLYAHGETQEA